MTSPMMGPTGKSGNKVPSGYKQYQLQNYTPNQMSQHDSLFEHVNPDSFLSRLAGGDQSGFDEMEAPAMRQFAELQGNIASRFSGMGTGARKSSGFQNTMNQASSNFAQDLHSQRMGMRMKALEELMGFSDRLLNQKPYESGLVKKDQSSSGWGGAGGAAVGGIGGFFTGGVPGAMGGAKLGYDIGSSF